MEFRRGQWGDIVRVSACGRNLSKCRGRLRGTPAHRRASCRLALARGLRTWRIRQDPRVHPGVLSYPRTGHRQLGVGNQAACLNTSLTTAFRQTGIFLYLWYYQYPSVFAGRTRFDEDPRSLVRKATLPALPPKHPFFDGGRRKTRREESQTQRDAGCLISRVGLPLKGAHSSEVLNP